MVDYKTRLQKAMGEMHPQVLADHLGVSLQSVRKVLAGQSAAFNVPNHFEACKFLKVDAGWLATGEGEMRTGQAWPFGAEIAPEQFFALDPGAIQSAVDVLASAAKRQSLMSKLGAPSPAQDARVGEFIAPAPRHELSSGFGDLAPASGPANYKKVTQIPASKHPMKKRGT